MNRLNMTPADQICATDQDTTIFIGAALSESGQREIRLSADIAPRLKMTFGVNLDMLPRLQAVA